MRQFSATCIMASWPCMYKDCVTLPVLDALTMFASVFGAHVILGCIAQMVQEGIRASSVPAVLEKCVNDLLDLTDLVRGKLGVQVRVPPAGSSHINQSSYFSCLQDSSGIKGIGHEPCWTCTIYKCCSCNSARNASAQELIDSIVALLCNHRSACNRHD